MRIGELAREIGASTDTVRSYERSGWLPRASRRDNDYRDYGEADVEHLRLLIDLRRLDVPLGDAGRRASWCHSGHCADTTAELPRLIGARRADIADRIARLEALDARLGGLERQLTRSRRVLKMAETTGPALRRRRRRGRIGGGWLRLLLACLSRGALTAGTTSRRDSDPVTTHGRGG